MSAFIASLVVLGGGTAIAVQLVRMNNMIKDDKNEKEAKDLYFTLWDCFSDETIWERYAPHYYGIENEGLHIRIFHADDYSPYHLSIYKDNKRVMAVTISENGELDIRENKWESHFDFRYLLHDEECQTEWFERFKKRFREEELKEKRLMSLNPLKREWEVYKKKEEVAFSSLMDTLSMLDVVHLPIEETVSLSFDDCYQMMIRCDANGVHCRIAFANGIDLFTAKINRTTGKIDVDFPLNHIRNHKRTQLLSLIQQIADTCAIRNETGIPFEEDDTKSYPSSSKEKEDVFRDLDLRLRQLQHEKEWLTDTERHAIFRTYPNDVLAIRDIYLQLSDKGKEKSLPFIERSKEELSKKLTHIIECVEKRKIKKIEEHVRIVEARSD